MSAKGRLRWFDDPATVHLDSAVAGDAVLLRIDGGGLLGAERLAAGSGDRLSGGCSLRRLGNPGPCLHGAHSGSRLRILLLVSGQAELAAGHLLHAPLKGGEHALAARQGLRCVSLGHVAVALAADPLLDRLDYSIVIFWGRDGSLGARQQILVGGTGRDSRQRQAGSLLSACTSSRNIRPSIGCRQSGISTSELSGASSIKSWNAQASATLIARWETAHCRRGSSSAKCADIGRLRTVGDRHHDRHQTGFIGRAACRGEVDLSRWRGRPDVRSPAHRLLGADQGGVVAVDVEEPNRLALCREVGCLRCAGLLVLAGCADRAEWRRGDERSGHRLGNAFR